MITVFLLLVFISELAAVAAIGYAAFVLAGGGLPAAAIALVVIAVVIAVWALWAAPKADVTTAVRLTTKLVVFGLAVLGLVVAGRPWWALGLAVLVIVSVAGAAAGGYPPGAGHTDHPSAGPRTDK